VLGISNDTEDGIEVEFPEGLQIGKSMAQTMDLALLRHIESYCHELRQLR
jgi:hypothetical protein